MNKYLHNLYEDSITTNSIDSNYYNIHNVKRGLRNDNGTGVIVGLTKISDVNGYEIKDGVKYDIPGKLYYRGIELKEVIKNVTNCRHNGYEQTIFLLLFGYLPNDSQLIIFSNYLLSLATLPKNFVNEHILKTPSISIMNKIQRCILMLYSFDDDPDNTSVESVLEKGISLIAKMPLIISYAYQSKSHYYYKKHLIIKHPRKEYTFSENILYLSRKKETFTEQEAGILDLLMIVHADHGGANNSTFANIVISSSGTDVFSAFSGAAGSLKGSKHGGANLYVTEMFTAIKNEIGITNDRNQIERVLTKILKKEFYDKTGLIYGLGHAVYTISDPRAVLLKAKTESLAREKNRLLEYEFYSLIEEIGIRLIKELKGNDYNCCANVDFYSGFVYDMLEIPKDLFTPIFAASRMVGWLAHNLENKLYCDKIIRPASVYVGERE